MIINTNVLELDKRTGLPIPAGMCGDPDCERRAVSFAYSERLHALIPACRWHILAYEVDVNGRSIWQAEDELRRPSVRQTHETLAYVDKSLDNVADLDPDLTWTNTEVIQVLEDIRSLLVTGNITPGMFEQTRSPSDGAAEPAAKIGGQA